MFSTLVVCQFCFKRKKPNKLKEDFSEVNPRGGLFQEALGRDVPGSHLGSRKLAALGRMRMKFFTTVLLQGEQRSLKER